ncbi:acyltransferase family protein [Hymenobacter ruricola]|uniref:Acyltransferase n=1 Tax=Hymenobacter ruricola TaxID=2791023 RepID=A0ABS0I255_9BACT|nr:acyltransferase [Hymenobacter ruricola]MBF9221034.1 acyltransferase [Hymenobacter ruricola]
MKPPSQPSPISTSTSVALDALRLLAALVVVVFHASSQWLTDYPALHEALGRASHAAVVVFFVLSGYVIAFTTAANNRGPRQYAVARLSRLYSMLGPALLLTALVEIIVVNVDAPLTARYVHEHSGLRYLLTAAFGSESGPLSAAPPLNSPLWSLSYEFWYYALFGLWCYRAAIPRAGWWLAGAAVLAGPKILLMLPVWLFGVAAWRWPKWSIGRRQAGLWFTLFLVLSGLAVAYVPAWPVAVGVRPLFLSGQFVTDWLVGALVALAIWGLPGAGPGVASTGAPAFRRLAELSFPLYAFHFPLLVLWRVALGWRANDWLQLGQVVAGICVAAGLLGIAFERQRRGWIRLFERLAGVIRPRRAPAGK